MELINLKILSLTTEKSGDIIKFLAQRRGITTKKLLSTIRLIKPTKPQQTLSNTKERIEVIRKKLNELHNKFSKSELKEIRNHLYNIENKNELENSNEYLNELDKKLLN